MFFLIAYCSSGKRLRARPAQKGRESRTRTATDTLTRAIIQLRCRRINFVASFVSSSRNSCSRRVRHDNARSRRVFASRPARTECCTFPCVPPVETRSVLKAISSNSGTITVARTPSTERPATANALGRSGATRTTERALTRQTVYVDKLAWNNCARHQCRTQRGAIKFLTIRTNDCDRIL